MSLTQSKRIQRVCLWAAVLIETPTFDSHEHNSETSSSIKGWKFFFNYATIISMRTTLALEVIAMETKYFESNVGN